MTSPEALGDEERERAVPLPVPTAPRRSSGLRRGPSRARPSLGEEEKLPTREEIDRLLAYLEEKARRESLLHGAYRGPMRRNLLLVRVALATGLRASEIARLEMEDLHLGAEPYLRVRGGKKRPASHVATVPLPARLAEDLGSWTMRPFSGLPIGRILFPTTGTLRALRDRGTGLIERSVSILSLGRRGVWKIVKRAIRRAGLRECLNVHSLRHAYITALARAPGADPLLVAKLARIRSTETVLTYFHVGAGDRRRLVESLERPRGRR